MQFPRRLGMGTFFAFAGVILFGTPFGQENDFCAAGARGSLDGRQAEMEYKLSAGETVVSCEDINGTKFVVGRILIDQPPERVWPTLVNPFEFERKICPRMSRVKVVADQARRSTLACTMDLPFPLPDITYVVESKYTPWQRVEFKRVGGAFRDIRGFWKLSPVKNGTATEVTYSMYLDPGIPVPDWVVRQGVRCELPGCLEGLRRRVGQLRRGNCPAEKRTIVAAGSFLEQAKPEPVTREGKGVLPSRNVASGNSACPAFISPAASLAHPP